MPLHWAILAAPDDHVGNVLRIRNIARSEKANLSQWIEPGRCCLFYGRELEADMAPAGTKARGLCPVFSLDVINDRAFFLCQ